jgi:hypothetical protein
MLAFPPDFRQDDRLKNVRDSTGDDLGMLQEKQRSLQFIQERFHLEEEDLDILFSRTLFSLLASRHAWSLVDCLAP